ncbi:MAG: glycosyltransferase family 2 protein [Acutalibacter sp.]
MEVKVSIIIPVYGVELFLERAVDSALEQTLAEKEIILVDDGSPDACPEICERYAREHPGLVRVLHQENQGLGMARNAGAALAQGEYLLFLDSDDTIQPEMAQALYEKAKAGGCDLVMCDNITTWRKTGRWWWPPIPGGSGPGGLHCPGNITYSVNKLFRRSIWQENRYEDAL